MKCLIFTLFLMLWISATQPAEAMAAQDLQQEMQQQLAEAQQAIKNAQQALDKAIAGNEDPSVIQALRNHLSILQQQKKILEEMAGGLADIPQQADEEPPPDVPQSDAPPLDARRINALPKRPLTDAQLAPFLLKVRTEVDRALPASARTDAASLYGEIRGKWGGSKTLADIASTCWMNGHPETALYLMGIAVSEDHANANNLNNYAAFLSMAGGEHAAIPLLGYLDAKFPNNSTILNNLGQAWFGLGDTTKAKTYLNMAVAAYSKHSQANQTLARIYKSEGQASKAVEAIKRSISEDYTAEKESMITDLGGTLSYSEVPFNYPLPNEPLGLDKFIMMIPEYPMSAGEERSKTSEWNGFKIAVSAMAEAEYQKIRDLQKSVDAFQNTLKNRKVQPAVLRPFNNNIVAAALRKQQLLLIESTDRGLREEANRKRKLQIIKDLRRDYDAQTDGDCYLKRTFFLAKANQIWHDLNFEEVRHAKQRIVESVGFELYSSFDQSMLSQSVLKHRWGFLNLLGSLAFEGGNGCDEVRSVVGPRSMMLPDFDDVNCPYKSTLFVPPFTTIHIECNKLVTEFDVDSELGPNAKLSIEENLATGKYTKGNLEIGVSKEIGAVGMGPLKAEASAGGSLGVEVTSDGVKQVYVKAGISGAVGAETPGDMASKNLSATGAEVTVSWNAGARGESGSIGTSLSGQGVLKDVSLTGP